MQYKAILIFLLLLVAFLPEASATTKVTVRRPKQAEMLPDWIGPQDSLTIAKLKKLIDWASLDKMSDSIVKSAMARYGATDLQSFLPLFSVDDRGAASSQNRPLISHRGGFTSCGDIEVETLSLLPEDRFSGADLENKEPYHSQIEAFRLKKDAYFAYAVNHSVDLRVYFFSKPTIHLTRGETLRQSYESFIHELTHFVRCDLRNEPNPTAFDSAEDFEAAYLLAPGQEADARITGVRALIELLRKLPDETSIPVELEQWFTPRGRLLAKPGDILLVIRDYMGYHAAGLYKNRLEMLLMEDDRELQNILAIAGLSELHKERVAQLEAEISRIHQLLR